MNKIVLNENGRARWLEQAQTAIKLAEDRVTEAQEALRKAIEWEAEIHKRYDEKWMYPE